MRNGLGLCFGFRVYAPENMMGCYYLFLSVGDVKDCERGIYFGVLAPTASYSAVPEISGDPYEAPNPSNRP